MLAPATLRTVDISVEGPVDRTVQLFPVDLDCDERIVSVETIKGFGGYATWRVWIVKQETR